MVNVKRKNDKMDVYDVLRDRDGDYVRVYCNNRWAILCDKQWTVYIRKPYAHKTRILYEGYDENMAMNILKDGEYGT